MEYLAVLGGIAGVFLLACLSPGPVWLIITSTAVTVSRRAGMLTGLGVAGATLTWATLSMFGIVLLAQLSWLTVAIRLTSAAYLVWIGTRMLIGARAPARAGGPQPEALHDGWAALRRGYVASITNPKAAAFFSSIFVVMLPPLAPVWVYAATVLLLAALSALWHCGLAVVFSVSQVQAGYRRAKSRIDSMVGVILIGLGLRLAVSR